MFSRLARPKVFTNGATESKVSADRSFNAAEVNEARVTTDGSVFAPGATESFYEWCDRIKSVRRPQFYCGWGERSTSYRRQKRFRAWREWQFFRFATGRTEVSTNRIFFRTKATSVSQPKFCFDWFKSSTCDRWRNRFSNWREWGKNDQRPKFLRLGWPKVFFDWRDQSKIVRGTHFFCNWGDRRTSDRRPKHKAESFSTGVTEA